MNRIWAALAVALAAFVAATGCNDYGNTFQYSVPSLISVSPSNITAGGPDFTITINADLAQLQPKTYITWNQTKISTTVTTDPTSMAVTGITAVVPAADIAKPGTFFIQAVNPNNTNGTGYANVSNAIPFIVFPTPNPVPTVTSITPTSAAAGSADLALTITGTNFLTSSDPSQVSQVNWNAVTQVSLAISNITATQIQATVKAAQLAKAGTATVTVYNPPAPPPQGCQANCTGSGGGGTSNAATFTITPPGAAVQANAAVVQEETPALSADGRYVAYTAAQAGHAQILARDTCLGADSSCQPRTILASSAQDGTAADDDSHTPSMSSDGRYVAFSSAATNLVSGAAPGRQVYLRDTCFGAGNSCIPSTQLISTDPRGALVGAESILPSVSSSGRFVAFLAVSPSHASGPVSQAQKSGSAPPNSGFRQVFVRDTCLGAANCTPSTTRISLQPGDGADTGAKPVGPALSGSADQAAINGGNTATLFTRSVPVDDGVFLALTKNQ
ncbi:MAG TPA: IPT/TIG domain-containing protein [Candidatus Methylomirabilis sp.]|nr:IPT/TIG domain-containing protein [Candidatus Methylomirabilis sp.]